MTALTRTLLVVLLTLFAGTLSAQATAGATTPPSAATGPQLPQVQGPQEPAPSGPINGPSISVQLSAGSLKPKTLGSSIEIVLLMTLLSLAPAIVLTMTCFTRIIIVLSFLKRAMSMQDLPPTMVVTGFAVFMTIFIMKPVATDIYENAYVPYVEEQEGFTFSKATDAASTRMSKFLLSQTRDTDLQLILDLSGEKTRPASAADTPFYLVVPAFILSEIKTAFQMGFVLFLPFVIIDLVIASLLVSMGMFTLPPVVVSTPMKLLLFVMVDGWNLVVTSLAQSFSHQP